MLRPTHLSTSIAFLLMPSFAYITAQGQRGQIEAESPREARDHLRAQGVSLADLQPQRPASQGTWGRWRLRRLARRHRGEILSELGRLLHVGVGLDEALQMAGEDLPPVLQESLRAVRGALANGASFGEASAANPDLFDPISLRMIALGERGGHLPEVLARLSTALRGARQHENKLLTALSYPMLVVLLGVGVGTFLMTQVVPELLANLSGLGQELPPLTLAVKAVSDTLVHHGLWLALAALALGITATAQWRQPRFAAWRRRTLGRVPLLGAMLRHQEQARFCFALGLLCASDLPLDEALQMSAPPHGPLKAALATTHARMQDGVEAHAALRASGAFTPACVKVIALGQQTGELAPLLAEFSTDEQARVDQLTARLLSAVEPLLMVLLAVFVGVIAFAVVLPILQIGQAL